MVTWVGKDELSIARGEGHWGSSLVVQWLGLSAFTAMAPGSIPGWETEIPKATRAVGLKMKESSKVKSKRTNTWYWYRASSQLYNLFTVSWQMPKQSPMMLVVKVLPVPLDWICLSSDWSEAISAQCKIIGHSNSAHRKGDQRLRFYIKHANFTFPNWVSYNI